MTQYQQSPLNKYMYNEFENTERQEKNQEESQHGGDKEQNNDYIKVGGYPIQQLILGGNNDRFKNLVVPAGLVMDDYSNDNSIIYSKQLLFYCCIIIIIGCIVYIKVYNFRVWTPSVW